MKIVALIILAVVQVALAIGFLWFTPNTKKRRKRLAVWNAKSRNSRSRVWSL